MSLFDRRMTHDVIPIKVTTDGYGNPSSTPLNEEKGFFQYDEKTTYNTDGNLVRCVGDLFLKSDSQFDPTLEEGGKKVKWKFTDVKNDRTVDLEEFKVIDDPRTGGTHHYEILMR